MVTEVRQHDADTPVWQQAGQIFRPALQSVVVADQYLFQKQTPVTIVDRRILTVADSALCAYRVVP